MRVWQIATGEPKRDYGALFFDHDVMLLGPSDRGDARAASRPYADGGANSAPRQVDAFQRGPAPGDRVIARLGTKVIRVGEIPGGEAHGYDFDERFRAVLGWDLCHRRRVVWGPPTMDLSAFAGAFGASRQRPSFTEVLSEPVVAAARSVDAKAFARAPAPLPSVDTSRYTDEELGVALFRAGISNRNIEAILSALRQAERLCAWYWSDACGRQPSEREVVTHIVLPILFGLGWSHQQVAVEWNRVDVALFKVTPTTTDRCVAVVEAKGLGTALEEVVAQALGYIEHLHLTAVRTVIVTDGANLLVYDAPAGASGAAAGGGTGLTVAGYINVARLQKQYLLPRAADLVSTLVRLQPQAM